MMVRMMFNDNANNYVTTTTTTTIATTTHLFRMNIPNLAMKRILGNKYG